jgi:hypothetical protein
MRHSGYAIVCAGVAAAIASPAFGQDFAATSINRSAVAEFDVYGTAQKAVVDDPVVPGGKALRVTVPGKGANPWDGGVISKVTGPIKAGDELVYVFYARLEKGEGGATSASLPANTVSLANPPYTALFGGPATIGPKWKMLKVRWVADKDYAPGTLQAGVQVATGNQVIDFGPMYVSKMAAGAVAAAPAAPAATADLSSKMVNDPSAPEVNGAKAQLVNDPRIDGGKALRVAVSKKGPNNWASNVETSLNKPVKKGDKLVLMFNARLQEGPSGAAAATIPHSAIQMKAAPYSSLVSGQAALTGDWKSYRFEGTADKDHAAGALKASIQIGNAKQTIDFGPIVVLNMGQ